MEEAFNKTANHIFLEVIRTLLKNWENVVNLEPKDLIPILELAGTVVSARPKGLTDLEQTKAFLNKRLNVLGIGEV